MNMEQDLCARADTRSLDHQRPFMHASPCVRPGERANPIREHETESIIK